MLAGAAEEEALATIVSVRCSTSVVSMSTERSCTVTSAAGRLVGGSRAVEATPRPTLGDERAVLARLKIVRLAPGERERS